MSGGDCADVLIEKFRGIDLSNASGWVKLRENGNEAVRLFSEHVVANKDVFVDEEAKYSLMMQAYLNILMYVESGMKSQIKDILDSLGVDPGDMQMILKLSCYGRYHKIQRGLRWFPKDYKYRKKFLNLIEEFAVPGAPYGRLAERLEMFVVKRHRGGPAVLTGILSALRDEEFMVYNKRSALPFTGTKCEHLANARMSNYEEFNGIYRSISKKTGWGLLEIDTVANDLYWRYLGMPADVGSDPSQSLRAGYAG